MTRNSLKYQLQAMNRKKLLEYVSGLNKTGSSIVLYGDEAINDIRRAIVEDLYPSN